MLANATVESIDVYMYIHMYCICPTLAEKRAAFCPIGPYVHTYMAPDHFVEHYSCILSRWSTLIMLRNWLTYIRTNQCPKPVSFLRMYVCTYIKMIESWNGLESHLCA